MSAVRMFTVPPEADSCRIYRFLRKYFPELPERFLRDAFSRRDVRVNGKKSGKEIQVFTGDQISVFFPESALSDPLSIVFENSDILLVDKQPGISVEPDAGGGITLTDLCRRHVLSADAGAYPPRACHRLDHRTGGLCVFAKNENAMNIITDVFRKRTLEKYYECLVKGIVKPPSAECRAFLVKDSSRSRVSVLDHPVPGAKRIITGYETLTAGNITRLRVHLITGRTHQIRAHLSALGHPILGDDLYGDRIFNRENKARFLCLYAVSLKMNTQGRLPELDNILFSVKAPF